MSTQTETQTKITIITIPAVFSKVEAGEKNAAKVDARWVDYASLIRKEADMRDWSEMDASLSLKQTFIQVETGWIVSLSKAGTSKNARVEIVLPKDADFTESDVRKVIDRQNSDVSKVIRLAYPAEGQGAKELALAHEHNKPISDYRKRVGVNALLEIARGKKTLAEVLNPTPEAAPAAPAAAPATTATETTPATTQSATEAPAATTPPTTNAAGGPLSLADRFSGATAACKADGLTYPEALRLLNEVYGKAN